MIDVMLPDGSSLKLPDGANAADLATQIGPGLAKSALAARVNNAIVDLTTPLQDGDEVSVLTKRDPEALDVLRHSAAHLMADAIVSLLDRRYVRSARPLAAATFGFMLLLAGVGCVLPVRLAAIRAIERPRHRPVLWTVVLGLAALSFVMMALGRSPAAVHLGMAGFSLLAPMAGGLWVEFVRNRHRILDRSRRAIATKIPTVTGSRTRKSRNTARCRW